MLRTLRLLLPKGLQLTEKHLKAHQKLYEVYDRELFTYLEACRCLKVGSSTLRRYLTVLVYHGLIRKHAPRSKRVLLEVLPEASRTTCEGGAFEEMQGEWKEYRGFVSL